MLSWNVKCPVGILKVLLKDGDVLCFDDIVVKINELPSSEGKNINKVYLILVIPATSAFGERSFTTDRRLKTCFRSITRQERFSRLTILNRYKEKPGRLSLVEIANEF